MRIIRLLIIALVFTSCAQHQTRREKMEQLVKLSYYQGCLETTEHMAFMSRTVCNIKAQQFVRTLGE